MMTEHQIQLAHDIAGKLADCWWLIFRSDPPTADTLLACGFVLAEMRLRAEKTKNPVYTHPEMSELISNTLALPEFNQLVPERFSEDFVHISRVLQLVTVSPDGVILEDAFFINYLGLGAYNGK